MKKCIKVKNPCKVCLQEVSTKNGLQCKGACKKWAHFTCLNYTPGRIHDIKAGIITVTCPCPNCNIPKSMKEHLTDPPFICNNEKCPSNIRTQCPEVVEVNKKIVSRGASPIDCVQVQRKCPSPIPLCLESLPPPSCCLNECPGIASKLKILSTESSSDPVDSPKSMKASSCTELSGGEGLESDRSSDCPAETKPNAGDCKMASSDSKLMSPCKQEERALLSTLHELCSTVGHLSSQIKDLLCKVIARLENNAC